MKRDITVELEKLVDEFGLSFVLTGLELVCGEKAEHLRANWQDNASARPWDSASKKLAKLAGSVEL